LQIVISGQLSAVQYKFVDYYLNDDFLKNSILMQTKE